MKHGKSGQNKSAAPTKGSGISTPIEGGSGTSNILDTGFGGGAPTPGKGSIVEPKKAGETSNV